MTDLAQPYIIPNSYSLKEDSNTFYISWTVGGAITVDETFILYAIKRKSNVEKKEKSFSELIQELKRDNFKDFDYNKNFPFSKTNLLIGRTTWKLNDKLSFKKESDENNDFEHLEFQEKIELPKDATEISYIILVKVDKVRN